LHTHVRSCTHTTHVARLSRTPCGGIRGRYSPRPYIEMAAILFIIRDMIPTMHRCRHLCIIQPGASDVSPLFLRSSCEALLRHGYTEVDLCDGNLSISASCDKHFLECGMGSSLYLISRATAI